jgi:hypothetical protein
LFTLARRLIRFNCASCLPHSPVANLKQRVLERERQIADLEEKLAAAETSGSLFDLKRDSVDTIAAAIIGNMSESRAKRLADAITAKLRKPKPAG